MANKLLSIDISEGALDNVYTFYDDGQIERFYDSNPYRLNNTIYLTSKELKGRSDLKKITAKCTDEQLAILKDLLGGLD